LPILTGQFFEGFVQGEYVVRRRLDSQLHLTQIESLTPPAVLSLLLSTGTFDENPPHGLSCSGEEVTTTIPMLLI
jgi:hypothetical protein